MGKYCSRKQATFVIAVLSLGCTYADRQDAFAFFPEEISATIGPQGSLSREKHRHHVSKKSQTNIDQHLSSIIEIDHKNVSSLSPSSASGSLQVVGIPHTNVDSSPPPPSTSQHAIDGVGLTNLSGMQSRASEKGMPVVHSEGSFEETQHTNALVQSFDKSLMRKGEDIILQVAMNADKIAANTAGIASMSAELGTVSAVAASNSVAIAGLATGLGAVIIIGIAVLIYVCWPGRKEDSEARISEMINDRFNEERRIKLAGRLKRYLTQFIRCQSAWVAMVGSNDNHALVARSFMDISMSIARARGDNRTVLEMLPPSSFMELNMSSLVHSDAHVWNRDDLFAGPWTARRSNWPYSEYTPNAAARAMMGQPTRRPKSLPCLGGLERIMSIERDEWVSREGNSLSALFVPFANFHTQLQEMLVDFPSVDSPYMGWDVELVKTASEYGTYIMDSILSAWKAHVCRTVRLRKESKGLTRWTTKTHYELTVLKPEYQPNAGKDCEKKCDKLTGWCSFCGGKTRGACCKRGDPNAPSECNQFDIPTFTTGAYYTCVHTDCNQMESYYDGGTQQKAFKFRHDANSALACANLCAKGKDNVYFSLYRKMKVFDTACYCSKAGATRRHMRGATSGPINCKTEDGPGEFQSEEQKLETPTVPMAEETPCELSPEASNGPTSIQEAWLKDCLRKVLEETITSFSPYYKGFVDFIDSLARRANCLPKVDGSDKETADINYDELSNRFEFEDFRTCNWDKLDSQIKRGRGYNFLNKLTIKSERVSDEQKQLRIKFLLPKWLHDRMGLRKCFAIYGPNQEDLSAVDVITQALAKQPKEQVQYSVRASRRASSPLRDAPSATPQYSVRTSR